MKADCLPLRTVFILLACLIFVSSLESCQSDVKPINILYINIDDLGWADLGFQGSEFYETPNLDRFAEQSMVFTNAYAPASNCAPSRATCQSGEYAPRHGVFTVNNPDRGQSEHRRLIPVQNQTDLSSPHVTIAEVLRQAGYATAHIGKWHLGKDPTSQGYTVNIGGNQSGHPRSYFSPYTNPNLTDGPEGEYLTDRLTEEAIRFLENNQDGPFFLNLAFYTVHTPLQAKGETVKYYESKAPSEAHYHPVYAAMIAAMDSSVGSILETLDHLRLSDRTFVIYSSDNGGVFRHTRQWPLRAGKGSFYEGGIRVPLVIRWPGHTQPGSRSDVPVSGIDFFPTILEVVGIEKPEGKILDGISLVPLLTGNGTLPDRPLFWHFPFYLENGNRETRDILFRTRPGSVIRKGDWKLHHYFEDNGTELYNLAEDPGEKQDLSPVQPEKVKELLMILNNWRQEVKAPVSDRINPEFDSDAERTAMEERLKRIDY